MALDGAGPVVTDADVDLGAQLQQLADVQLPDVIEALDLVLVEGQALVVGFAVVEALPDAAHAGDAQRAQTEDVGGAHVVDVRSDPAAVVELPKVRRRLMVAGHEDGQVGGGAGAAVVLVEVA